MKWCITCHSKKNLHVNARKKLKSGKESIHYMCRRCSQKRVIAYRKTEKGKQAVKRMTDNYEKKHPGIQKIWASNNWHLPKPTECSRCGGKKNLRKTIPDKSKPHEIVALCAVCMKK